MKQQGFSDAEYVSKKKQTLRLRAGRARREAFLAEMVRAGAVVDAGGADRAALPEGRQFGYVKVRYRGLAKNTAQLHTPFALTNIWMARRKFLVTG